MLNSPDSGLPDLDNDDTRIDRFDDKGEGFIELALVLILVAIVLIVILLLLGPNIREFFNSLGLLPSRLTVI